MIGANIERNLFKACTTYWFVMSKKKNAPLPASSAGLLRFFEDETKGTKIKPEIVLGATGALIGISILIRIIFPVS